jgi:hypothetical protein
MSTHSNNPLREGDKFRSGPSGKEAKGSAKKAGHGEAWSAWGRSGAEHGARTRDLNLGKVALYQLS